MPHTRPAKISDGVSLSDKVGAKVARFVAEDGAIDSLLPTSVNEASPHKESVGLPRPQADVFAGADELFRSPSDAAGD